jgi:hypothetical protein
MKSVGCRKHNPTAWQDVLDLVQTQIGQRRFFHLFEMSKNGFVSVETNQQQPNRSAAGL